MHTHRGRNDYPATSGALLHIVVIVLKRPRASPRRFHGKRPLNVAHSYRELAPTSITPEGKNRPPLETIESETNDNDTTDTVP